jgi:hypothetical protein
MMAGSTKKSFDDADEVRTPPQARVDVVDIGGAKVARFTLQPGWRWSTSVKPIAGTDACQFRHVGAAISGRMRAVDADGGEVEIGAGDAYVIQPGHDAWVVGDEPFVAHEFETTTAESWASGT